jgi:hypothetical protein
MIKVSRQKKKAKFASPALLDSLPHSSAPWNPHEHRNQALFPLLEKRKWRHAGPNRHLQRLRFRPRR